MRDLPPGQLRLAPTSARLSTGTSARLSTGFGTAQGRLSCFECLSTNGRGHSVSQIERLRCSLLSTPRPHSANCEPSYALARKFSALSLSCHESSFPGIRFRERQSPDWRRRAKRAATLLRIPPSGARPCFECLSTNGSERYGRFVALTVARVIAVGGPAGTKFGGNGELSACFRTRLGFLGESLNRTRCYESSSI